MRDGNWQDVFLFLNSTKKDEGPEFVFTYSMQTKQEFSKMFMVSLNDTYSHHSLTSITSKEELLKLLHEYIDEDDAKLFCI